jgi:Ran GTPase-activating protein (RanGAP) involved in mRNA processing and transport
MDPEDDDDEDYDSDDTWESDLESEAEIAEIMQLDIAEDSSTSGKKEYLAKCSELKIVPVAMFIAKLDCEHINLRHHGMGVKGALAISAALFVNTQIRSLNLGDNWLRDDGTHALAQVFSSNTALTSINLSDNRIGLPGVLSLCHNLQDNSSLAELSLKGNGLTDRAAVPLAETLKNSSSLTKVDLSYNDFGEEAGKLFGDMLNGHSHLLDVSLKWNNLKAKGGEAVAEGLKQNQVLNKVDLGWNGMGDAGMTHIGEMLKSNAAITHLDISHNRVNPQGCVALAEGIKENHNLLSLEVNFNPMGVSTAGKLTHDASGIVALIDALRASENIESVGLSNVQSGGSYARGRASRFDPKNPDGHYALALDQPWDRFIAETLYDRMAVEKGESWINVWVKGHPVEIPNEGWALPPKGTLEFDYVTWKRGLEASFRLDLSNPCDLFLAERLLQRGQAAEAGGGDGAEGAEELRECKLNDEPLDPSSALPASGILQVVYFSTLQQDTITFDISLDLSGANDRAICLRLWERALTTPTDDWGSASLDGAATTFDAWQYPHVPDSGALAISYAVRLAIKPYDRGLFFSPPMSNPPFQRLLRTLEGRQGEAPCSDFDKVNLLRQAATRNYFTTVQIKSLVDVVAYRKGKIEAAVLLHPRCTDQANFVQALKSLEKETDRQDILEMVGASIKKRMRKEIKAAHQASNILGGLSAAAASSAAARAAEGGAAAEGGGGLAACHGGGLASSMGAPRASASTKGMQRPMGNPSNCS